MLVNFATLGACLSWLTATVKAEHHVFEWVIEDWVVDFMRPTVHLNKTGGLPWAHPEERKQPFHMAEEQRKHALLINGQYPGPLVDVYENDTVEIKVINKMMSEATTIHWHGIHLPGVSRIWV
jgi:FtsP/CotA-like multicopper oxidase with cupredoxin domain